MRTIEYKCYFDKVLGGWTGKCLGGTIGCFEGTKQITNLNIYDLLPESMVANDDLDIQLVWMDVLLEKGIHFTSEQLMESWLLQYDYNFGEYATGRRNYLRGLKPPVCGKYANLFYLTGMGCPIRSEIWGMIAPGNGELAAEYAYKDGILDHEGESVWAEQFLSAVEALAFFENDLMTLIDAGLEFIPCKSLVHQCIEEARSGFKKGYPWQETWKRLRDNYGHPDCTYAPQNLGIIVMALLYGEKDFDKTLTIAVNSAWDVDCTCSTTAAILGIITGYEAFDQEWLRYIGDDIVTMARPKNAMHSIRLLSEYTCRAGITIVDEGLTDLKIINIPEHTELLKTDTYVGRISMKVDYCGEPVIKSCCPKEIKLIIQNNTQISIHGKITISTLSEALELYCITKEVTLAPYEKHILDVCANIKKGAELVYDTNLIKCDFLEGTDNITVYEFGLCGSPEAVVIGPYYDTYMEWLRKEDMTEKRLLKSGNEVVIIPKDSEEWGNHRVDIDKLYQDEDFSSIEKTRGMFNDGRKYSIVEDRYLLKDTFGFQGSACVYYYQEIFCPEIREGAVFIGSSDPFKLWINGDQLVEQKENRFWYPNQDVVNIKFHKGINYVVLKLARKGADNMLTMAFRYKQELEGYDSAPYMTDLAFPLIRTI